MAAIRISLSSILCFISLMTVSLFTTADLQGSANSLSPLIMPQRDSIVVDAGGTLNLTCRDTQKVVWVAPKHSTLFVNYEESYDGLHERPHVANLVIENMNYTNVGYYFCVHNTTENKQKEEFSPDDANASSIYVFVKDLTHLLAKEAESIMHTPVVNQSFTFPCKPTFPEVFVTLDKNQGTYDPRAGFTFVPTGDEDVLTCTGRYRDFPSAERDFIITHKEASERCLNPTREEDMALAINKSSFAIVGVPEIIGENGTHLEIVITQQLLLPRWIFGSPKWCCSSRRYLLLYSLSEGNSGHGCYIETSDDFHPRRPHQLFFIKASNNYTVNDKIPLEAVARPMSYNYTTLEDIKKLTSRTEKLKKPNIEVSGYWQKNEIQEFRDGKEHYDIEEGLSVNLTCKYEHDITSIRFLKWIVPSSVTNQSGTHLIHRDIKTGVHVRRILEITHANPNSDSGEYSCKVKNDLDTESDPMTVVINVLPIVSYNISLFAETPEFKGSPNEDNIISWGVLYSAYPDPTFIWWKEGEVLANSSNTNKGSKRYGLETKETMVFLEVESPTLNDIGVYTLEGLIMEKGRILSRDAVNLTFTMPAKPSKPEIEFTVNDREIKKGMMPYQQDFLLTCKSKGYPKPTMSLEFSECYERDNCTEFETISDESDRGNVLQSVSMDQTKQNLVNRTAVWKGRAYTQGIFRCSADNKEGSQHGKFEFLVIDGSHNHPLGLEVTVNGKPRNDTQMKILEADNVTVLCRGNKLKTVAPMVWKLNGEPLKIANLSLKHKVTRTLEDTDLSYVSILRFEKISLEEEPLKFTCEDSEVGTFPKIANQELRIEPMRAPKWSTKKPPLQDLQLYEMGNVVLSCLASGAPEPEIKWYKDDVLLEDTEEVDKKHRIINGSMITFGYLKLSDSGKYRCEATNRNGTIYSVGAITVTDPDAFADSNIIIIISVLSAFTVLISIGLFWKCYKDRKLKYSIRLEDQRMFEEGNPDGINPELGLDEQAELLPYDTKYEVPRDSIIFDKLLGAGAFGRVYRATAVNLFPGHARTTVAVKMMKSRTDSAQLKALRSEVKIMIHIGRHVNIVNLLGACSKELASKGELLLLVEYCRYGNILDYMRRHRKDFINQINEYDKIDPSITDARMRQRSGSGSRNRISRNLKYAHLSFNQDMVTYTPGQIPPGEHAGHAMRPEPSTPTGGSNGANGHIPESFRTRTLSGSSAVHVTSDMSTMTFESSTGTADGYVGSRAIGVNPVTLCSKELLCWAFQIAKGMEYLAFKKVLHGDLAARNILLTDENVVKISDFGLAKDIYKDDNYRKKSKTPVPWKWLAIECFRDSVFSTQSDIWSYGVVLWEIFSLGQSPYPGVEFDENFVAKLDKGIRPEQPQYATDELYRVMMDCWCNEPMERPCFSTLEQRLGIMLGEAEKQYYLELNTPYQTENTASTFVNFLQSPDYSAKVRDRNPNLDQDGYEMPFSPSPFGPTPVPHDLESIRNSRLTPLQMGYLQNERMSGMGSEEGAGCYVPMSSPSRMSQNVFSFEQDVVDSIAKRDSEIQIEACDRHGNDSVREENYISMQSSPNSDKSPHYNWQSNGSTPMRHKLVRTASQMEKHDSGLYSPTANMQCNPQYMVMDSFPKTDESNYLTRDDVHSMCNGNQPDYINLNDDLSPKAFQKDYIKDAMCNGEYTNLLQNEGGRGRTISEASSGLGSISEESPPECRIKPDSLKSSAMESVLEETVCA